MLFFSVSAKISSVKSETFRRIFYGPVQTLRLQSSKLIPVFFKDQILPGTFECALNHIVDNELDLSIFLSRYKNDQVGASAFDPAILLKIILFAYSHGITSSRKIGFFKDYSGCILSFPQKKRMAMR